jgi:MFS family permease
MAAGGVVGDAFSQYAGIAFGWQQQYNPWQTVGAGILGGFLGAIFSGNCFPAGTPVILGDWDEEERAAGWSGWDLAAGLAALGALLLPLVERLRKRRQEAEAIAAIDAVFASHVDDTEDEPWLDDPWLGQPRLKVRPACAFA